MAEVTYYVALPFIASDDGVVAGEPTECFNPNAAVMRAVNGVNVWALDEADTLIRKKLRKSIATNCSTTS
jgi:hypothetical protein